MEVVGVGESYRFVSGGGAVLTLRESWVGYLETTRLMRSELGTSTRRVPPNLPASFFVDSRFNIVYTR